jgi:hypothetical protein
MIINLKKEIEMATMTSNMKCCSDEYVKCHSSATGISSILLSLSNC